ncbi:type IV secretion system protein VirD4 [Croceifilum oryzae]|uniref:Type IV secretion system protein VirD4 n=1 Tax=Croceifilum oryzae TaxID=1553429 RepID=A0AAJ1WTE3_9BACL|nr:type IV secretory system conjugative DNA transfer family protein [Croceifilum oryzae]MDQ0418720.1 type IV secretion system protein VirD4 [Croceifilum oryzae]
MLTRLKETKKQVVGASLIGLIFLAVFEWVIGTIIVWVPRINEIESIDNVLLEMKHPIDIIQSALKEPVFVSLQYVTPILYVLCVVKLYKVLTGKGKYRTDAAYGAFGTARLAYPNEVFNNRAFVKRTWNQTPQKNLENKPGLIFGLIDNKPVILHEKTKIPNRNVFIVGSPGAGKTQSYILTNIIHEKERSIVVTDPKGEIMEDTARLKMAQGYKVKVINFKNMLYSDRYNPLDYLDREIQAEQVANTVVKNSSESRNGGDPFWIKAEVALLKTLLLYVKKECPEDANMANVRKILTTHGQTREEMDAFFDELAENHPEGEDHAAYQSYLDVKMAEDKVRGSIFVSLAMTLSKFNGPDVRSFMKTSDFLLDDIGKEKMIVYCILPVADSTWEPLISTFFSQLFQRLYEVADLNFNKLPVKVNLFLDEFPNLGRIPNYEEILATCRSYGISASTIVQSLGQLIDKYNKEKAESIIGNCSLRYLLGVGDHLTANYFSKLIGQTTVETRSTSSSKSNQGGSDSTSQNYSGRSLFTADELERMDEKEGILLVSGKYPMKLNKAFQFEFFQGILTEDMQVSRFEFLRERDGLPLQEDQKLTLEDMIGFGESVEPLSLFDQITQNMEKVDRIIGDTTDIQQVLSAVDTLVTDLSNISSEDDDQNEEIEEVMSPEQQQLDEHMDQLQNQLSIAPKQEEALEAEDDGDGEVLELDQDEDEKFYDSEDLDKYLLELEEDEEETKVNI